MGRINSETKPGIGLPEASIEEVVQLFGNYANGLLEKVRMRTWQGWFGPKIDQVVIRGLPQEPIDANYARSVVEVNGDYKRLTDAVLRSSLSSLARVWGCDLDSKPQIDSYKRRGQIIREELFNSASLPPISMVFRGVFNGSSGQLCREDLILRRFFYKSTPRGYLTYDPDPPFSAIPHNYR